MSILKMDQVVSVFENSSTNINYTYVNNEGDGRGLTCGRAGFTTSDGDALTVLEEYERLNPTNPLFSRMGIISQLKKLEANDDDSTDALDRMNFKQLWINACSDPLFIQAQDNMVDKTYFNPALQLAFHYFGAPSPFVILCFYDCNIQHGFDGPDSLIDIAARSLSGNIASILNFLSIRREVLMNPQDHSTKKEWSGSVGRVDALIALYNTGNFDLITPFTINPWEDDVPFTITGVAE